MLEEPRGESYRQLIRASLYYGDRFLLITNSLPDVDAPARSLTAALKPYLLSANRESEWPGTRLLEDTALVSSFSMRPETAKILGEAVEGLFDWIEPELPEDLCILRPDGSPWLVTISHEQDAYFQLSDKEKGELTELVPDLRLVIDS